MQIPHKADYFTQLFNGSGVYVHLEGTVKGVVLPDHLKGSPFLTLEMAQGMPTPIRDLVVDAEGLRVTLSFNRTPFDVAVPWDAVFAMNDIAGNGICFDDSKMSLMLRHLQSKHVEKSKVKVKPKKASPFVALPGGREKTETNSENEERPATHLRLVK
jgi:hypothetical protein